MSMDVRVMARDYVEDFFVVPTLTCNLVKVSVSVISLRTENELETVLLQTERECVASWVTVHV